MLKTQHRWLYAMLLMGFFALTATPYLIDLVLRPDRWNLFIMMACTTLVTIVIVSFAKHL